jgi:hypothetical protein
MFDFHSYQGKTIREIQHRHGGLKFVIVTEDGKHILS